MSLIVKVNPFILDYTSSTFTVEVVDGDTFKVTEISDGVGGKRVPLGKDKTLSIRLLGCNAIEKTDPGGLEAKQALTDLIGTEKLWLRGVIPDEYRNRFLAYPFLPDGTDVVETLVKQQWVARWNGRGVKPVPPWPRTVVLQEES